MRLLHYDEQDKLCITRDLRDDDLPQYAILSHTWGSDDDEVTFADLKLPSYHVKVGYQKIEFCGRQAQRDGLKYFWVDTCCIDKANNTELSKAITCMYRWYKNAEVCYVHLADVSSTEKREVSLRKSRWFTRGWTLQELLAPRKVLFYSKEETLLGTKDDTSNLLHEITGIPAKALTGEQPLSTFPVEDRMRWAQNRRTKEPEDRAYCLLGIFDVFMPLVYGEGDNAFHRLREEIDSRSMPSGRRGNIQLQTLTLGYQQFRVENASKFADLESTTHSLQHELDQLRKLVNSGFRKIPHCRGFDGSPMRLRAAVHSVLSTITFDFFCGKVSVRRHRLYTSLAERGHGNHGVRLEADFMPSPSFFQTRISVMTEWVARLQSLELPRCSLQFLDIIREHHPLIEASTKGDLSSICQILDSGSASVLSSTTEGWTPLHYAAAYGHTEVCTLLIEQGASLHATGTRGVSALHLSAHFGHLQTFKLLVEAGVDPDETHEHGINAMFELLSIGLRSSGTNLTDFLKWLLHGQARFPFDLEARDNSQRSILYYIAESSCSKGSEPEGMVVEQVEAIEYMLDQGLKGDELDLHGTSLLHEASRNGRLDLVQLLLLGDCDIDGIDGHGYTALHYAAREGDYDLVSLLVEAGAQMNVQADGQSFNNYGIRSTPLTLAATKGRIDVLRFLLKHRAGDPKLEVTDALHAALRHGHSDVARHLLHCTRDLLDLRQAIYASLDLCSDMIEELYEAGAPLDERSEPRLGCTPLIMAALNGWSSVVKILVALGADLNKSLGHDNDYNAVTIENNALWFAVKDGQTDVVRILVEAGARISPLGGSAEESSPLPIQLARENGYDEIVALLSTREHEMVTRISQVVSSSRRATDQAHVALKSDFMAACINGDLAIVEALLSRSCSVNASARSTWSPLRIALIWGHWKIVMRLIEAGAEQNFVGMTREGLFDQPFMEAVVHGNAAIIDFMIAHGGDVTIRSHDGATPLIRCLDRYWAQYICCQNGDIVRALIAAGACVNIEDDFGRTPLGMAAAAGNYNAVMALVEAGADLDKVCAQNSAAPPSGIEAWILRTPISWAAFEGHDDIVRALFDAGADWRSLKNEPAVWYTHRLLMEQTFPRTLTRRTNMPATMVGPARPEREQFPRGQRTVTLKDGIIDEHLLTTSTADLRTPTTCLQAKLASAMSFFLTSSRKVYDRIQLIRLEVAVVVCILLLLFLKRILLRPQPPGFARPMSRISRRSNFARRSALRRRR